MTMVNFNYVSVSYDYGKYIHDIFKILPSGVTQGSILGPLLLNDLFYFINDAQLNFADDNTIAAF